jgi:hypothetical protein
MAKDGVLARVDLDLARGHTYLALQRLASLTAAYPNDMELRACRAGVNRRIGNLVEAGRWGYLTEDVDVAEIVAFERAFPCAWARVSALRLGADPTKAVGSEARQRLSDLIREAERKGRASIVWTERGPQQQPSTSWRDVVGGLTVTSILLAVLFLLLIGLITVIRVVF